MRIKVLLAISIIINIGLILYGLFAYKNLNAYIECRTWVSHNFGEQKIFLSKYLEDPRRWDRDNEIKEKTIVLNTIHAVCDYQAYLISGVDNYISFKAMARTNRMLEICYKEEYREVRERVPYNWLHCKNPDEALELIMKPENYIYKIDYDLELIKRMHDKTSANNSLEAERRRLPLS